jgi:hypothetical protein
MRLASAAGHPDLNYVAFGGPCACRDEVSPSAGALSRERLRLPRRPGDGRLLRRDIARHVPAGGPTRVPRRERC